MTAQECIGQNTILARNVNRHDIEANLSLQKSLAPDGYLIDVSLVVCGQSTTGNRSSLTNHIPMAFCLYGGILSLFLFRVRGVYVLGPL